MNKPEEAVRKFNEDYNCAQSVLTTFSQELGLKEEIAKNLTAGFGAGINYRGEMCGAVSGALLTIGLKLGELNGFDELKKELTKEFSDKFIQLFQKENNSVLCKKLLNKDLSIPKELEEARELDIFSDICSGLVKSSAQILTKLLEEIENEQQELL